ncbi:hypothetical protein NBRC116493_32480 [Aurantivibrio infirmus]
MEFNQTFFILIGQSLFFVVILALCLKFAANKHRLHLKKIAQEINKTDSSHGATDDKNQTSQQIRELLMKKIQQLQTKNTALEKIEVEHTKLKEKYESLRLNMLKKPGESASVSADPGVASLKTAETKQEQFNRKAKCLSDASGSTEKASHELKSLNKKNTEQRDTIEILRSQIKKYELESNLNQMQIDKKNQALETLNSLENALLESQSTSERLENNLEKLRRELDKSQKEVDRLEKMRMQSESESISEKKTGDKKSYTLISKNTHDEVLDDEKDPFEIEAIQNYHNLKNEVQRLRSSTSEQRQMIFSLEGELIALRKELAIGGLSQEDQAEKEAQLSKLEKLLAETEGCVGILENEISYLQERIDSMSSDSEQAAEGAKEIKNTDEISQELDTIRTELEVASQRLDEDSKIRSQLAAAIITTSKTDMDSKVHVVATHVLEALEDFGEQIIVKINAKQGEIEVSSSDKLAANVKSAVTNVLRQSVTSKATEFDLIDNNQGLLAGHRRVGVYLRTGIKSRPEIEQLRTHLEYVLVVADSMVAAIDEGLLLKNQKATMQRLIQRVKKNLSTRAVQSKHQSAEIRRTVDDFLSELYTSLHTMNLTENQSKFFDVMIDEVKERMQVLFETEIAVDTAFVDFIEKLDRGGDQGADQA